MSDKPHMNLLGQDGNIFSVLGHASSLLRQAAQREQAEEMTRRVFACGSYDEALNIISEYVETELSPTATLKKNKQNKEKHTHER